MHFEHAEAMLATRLEKYRSAINVNKPVRVSIIADAIALAGLLNDLLQEISAAGIPTETREDFAIPLRGYFD